MSQNYRFHADATFEFKNPLGINCTLKVVNIAIVSTAKRADTQVYMTLDDDQIYNHTPTKWAELLDLSEAKQIS